MASLQFTDLERQRMQAAILATAIELFLMDRVDPHTARSSAHNIFVRLLPIVKQLPHSVLPECTEALRWNIFARELEDVLAARGLRIGQLDDRGVVLHREKVRRLQRSLISHKHLTTLNPEEMDRLIVLMHLSDEEQKRLRAALLATAVEMVLIDRIPALQALLLANDLFPFLLRAICDDDQDGSRVVSSLHVPARTPSDTYRHKASHSPDISHVPADLSDSSSVHAVPEQTQHPGVESSATSLIDAWLQHCEQRTGSQSTITTYKERLSQFRDLLHQQGHDLLSAPAIITHFAPLWASMPLSHKGNLAPLSHATVHQRLAVLSSFYQFVVRGQFDARFTTNPIPIHKAATSYRQVHPPLRGFDPQRSSEALQHLSCSTPERCRDYALLWIALTSARSPRDLLSLTISDLHFNAEANTYSLVWPEPNPRLRPIHLCLPTHVAVALLTYLCEFYALPLESLDASLPLWVSFSTRNTGNVISAQTLADIACKHLGTSSLRALLHAQDSCRHSSQSA